MQTAVITTNFQITPNRKFWEHDLELPIEKLMTEYSDVSSRQNWIESLSGSLPCCMLQVMIWILPRRYRFLRCGKC